MPAELCSHLGGLKGLLRLRLDGVTSILDCVSSCCFHAACSLIHIHQLLMHGPGCSLCRLICALQGLLHRHAGGHRQLVRLHGRLVRSLPDFRGCLRSPQVSLLGQCLGAVLRGLHRLQGAPVHLQNHLLRLLLQRFGGGRHLLPDPRGRLADASCSRESSRLCAGLRLPRILQGPLGSRCQGLLEHARSGPSGGISLAR
mmetsp:Transcript_44858/g.124738  ORF Transcript_44858/g.124738 Transcript_44858/m.124738 type:complete len:200 (+) Transcript_44858:949-1548(+)